MIDRFRERFKGFLQTQDKTETPKYWEREVSNSYRSLRFQMQLTQEARVLESFQKGEHANRIKTRIRNLKDTVFDIAGKEISIKNPPRFIWAESDKVYFYLPADDKLIFSRHEAVRSVNEGIEFIPVLPSAVDIDETVWCLDKVLVESLARNIVSLLPRKNAYRILGQAA